MSRNRCWIWSGCLFLLLSLEQSSLVFAQAEALNPSKNICLHWVTDAKLARSGHFEQLQAALESQDWASAHPLLVPLYELVNTGYPAQRLWQANINWSQVISLAAQAAQSSEQEAALGGLHSLYALARLTSGQKDDFYQTARMQRTLPKLTELPAPDDRDERWRELSLQAQNQYNAGLTQSESRRARLRELVESSLQQLRSLNPSPLIQSLRAISRASTLENFEEPIQILQVWTDRLLQMEAQFEDILRKTERFSFYLSEEQFNRIQTLTQELADESIPQLLSNFHHLTELFENQIAELEDQLDPSELEQIAELVRQRMQNAQKSWSLSVLAAITDNRPKSLKQLLRFPLVSAEELAEFRDPDGKSLWELASTDETRDLLDQFVESDSDRREP